MPILISVDELAELLESDAPVRVLDVRWRLDKPDGLADFRAGHIPGAVYVSLDSELAGHGAPTDGRHPLPAIEDLEASTRRWGINDGDTVVVYDDLKNMSSARAWWLLRHAGIADVRLLDGALRAWTGAGHPLEAGEADVVPGTVTLSYGQLRTVSLDEVAGVPVAGVLLDARAGERFRGDSEPVDPRAGHIPGALNTPTSENVDASGRFLPAGELRERFAQVGVIDGVEVATYCGSGVTAAHNIVALNLAGFDAALFPGSWSQWSNHPELPVETGGAD